MRFRSFANYSFHSLTKAQPFISYGSVVVELKALNRVGGIEQAQVINYLKATGHEIGLLINFGQKSLEHRRYILSKSV